MTEFATLIAGRLNIRTRQAETVLTLLAEGATVPFIARYRKDKTGALDEVKIQQILDESKAVKAFTERKTSIEKSIAGQGKMNEALQEKLDRALTLTELEDIYLPFKPKRKTKAQAAREKGLEPLALLILEQKQADLSLAARDHLNEEIKTTEEALQGARDIVAEIVHEHETVRSRMRRFFEETAMLESKLIAGKETEAAKFRDYFDYAEKIATIPSHRVLAVLRGFMEGFLRMSIAPVEEEALNMIGEIFIKRSGGPAEELRKAIRDGYRRLLQPGLESEFRMALKIKADEEAINVFAENLRQLLLSSPLGAKRILAVDPGYRTGCKVVCLDEQGDLQKTDLIFVHEAGRIPEAENKIRDLVNRFRVEAFAIGDGTAGRETEQFIRKLTLNIPVYLVNEDGASVYSASETAREEFPDQDITVRGAVSIGRRLMDPLAELVKIDPKSIGVGQYQHDVNQYRLKEKLDQTVIRCVNAVGVNLNTAGKQLLAYVSGIGEGLAGNIVQYRTEIGRFNDRQQLLKVTRLGDKAFEQCAGFLRIRQGKNPLDESAVHPEAYGLVEKMAQDLDVALDALIGNEPLIRQIDPKKYADETNGEHTIKDILEELKKPGLDPRTELETFEFAGIFKMEDVKPGMIVPGVVTNITRFGAFVDIGVKQDGLVHVSEMANRYIADPGEVLKLNDKVQVKVTEVDLQRKRIALSIKQAREMPEKTKAPSPAGVQRKNPPPSSGSMADALNALKKKFGGQA